MRYCNAAGQEQIQSGNDSSRLSRRDNTHF